MPGKKPKTGTNVIHGDCLIVMRGMEANSVDAAITDPSYGLSVTGLGWERGVAADSCWTEIERVCKPGAYLLAMGGARTHHRLWCAIEDAGFEIRDTIMWVYGSGFPKSGNIGGLGTALKPAFEPICVARKPLDGTVTQNIGRWGVGAMDIDGCRVGTETIPAQRRGNASNTRFASGGVTPERSGRWPANVIHDGSEGALAPFPNAGAPARFFYCAKVSRAEREMGGPAREMGGAQHTKGAALAWNHHPTVKPLALMEYLVRLVTRPGHVVLDPFMGSGTTGMACVRLGRGFIGVEIEAGYVKIARARIAAAEYLERTTP